MNSNIIGLQNASLSLTDLQRPCVVNMWHITGRHGLSIMNTFEFCAGRKCIFFPNTKIFNITKYQLELARQKICKINHLTFTAGVSTGGESCAKYALINTILYVCLMF